MTRTIVSPAMRGPKKSLTKEALDSFLRWLSEDRDQAGRQYERIRSKLITYFTRKGCVDPEYLSNQTLDRAVIIHDETPDKYPNPDSLCYGVARNVWLEDISKPKPALLDPDLIPGRTDDDQAERDRELACLESCLQELPFGDHALALKYYQCRGREKIETRKRLAQQYGGENTIRLRMFRIRNKLRECVDNCVQQPAVN